jgi:hypothetical protein
VNPRRAAAIALLLATSVSVVDIHSQEKRSGSRFARTGLSVFAEPFAVLDGNRVHCSILNDGSLCYNFFTSPYPQGGLWPVGTRNGYVFQSGLQVAGIHGPGAGPWANDTVGAFFVSTTGTLSTGTGLTDIHVSSEPEDFANWPVEALVAPDGVYDPVYAGRESVSGEDSWVRYWDGHAGGQPNDALQHPAGLEITQRSLAWEYPHGNSDILYFVFEVRNVTHEPVFQLPNELTFFAGEDLLPDEGWPIEEVHLAFTSDYDVDESSDDYTTAILPFDVVLSYDGDFRAEGFEYPSEQFHPPFFVRGPGLVGSALLRTPRTGDGEPGLTVATGYTGSSVGFPAPRSDRQLWRYLSGRLDRLQGDFPPNVPPQVETGNPATSEWSVLEISQSALDARAVAGTGPFRLEAGETLTLVAAHVFAATVETMPDGSPSGIRAGAPWSSNAPGIPSFHPGFASARRCDSTGSACADRLTAGENPVKPIERGAGWISYGGPAPTGRAAGALEGPENRLPLFTEGGSRTFELVPGSLLWKVQLARELVAAGFAALPAPPEPPPFSLIPGDGSVTVLWQPSPTVESGDPFWSLASDPASPFHNPNYLKNDVRRYRIWRHVAGEEEPTVVAEFDVDGFTFTDYTCETVGPDESAGVRREISPEDTVEVRGFAVGEICPLSSAPVVRGDAPYANRGFAFNNGGPGGIPGGGITRSEGDLKAVPSRLDSVTIASSEGVPFVWTDRGLYNNFAYRYGVTAEDLNSAFSGPISQESSLELRDVIPRADTGNVSYASVEVSLEGDDGQRLDPDRGFPALDPDDGTFEGPQPPTDGMALTLAPLVDRLTGQSNVTARVDSFKPDTPAREACVGGTFAFPGVCARAYLTVDGAPVEVPINVSNWAAFGRDPFSVTTVAEIAVPFDDAAREAFGIPNSYASTATAIVTQDESINFINWEGQQNRRAVRANTLHGGARWFSGTEETTPDPTKYIRVGHLAEVDSVWVPVHHTAQGPGEDVLPNSRDVQYFGYFLAHLGRAADFRVIWQEDGSIAVRDVTHNVDVPFSGEYGSSWGFLNDDGDGDGVISWWDFFCVGAMNAEFELVFGTICPGPLTLEPTPASNTIALNTAGDPTTGTTATGFTLYLNGMRHFFLGSPPPAGTVWTLRAYSGTVTASTGTDTDDPGGYQYFPIYDMGRGASGLRPALIPGLTLRWRSSEASRVIPKWDLTDVHTVPDPYLGTSRYDYTPQNRQLVFVNLPARATVRIFSLNGHLVQQLEHDDPTGGGRLAWDLRNRGGDHVASGVYFFHVATPAGDERVGKFTVIMGQS